MHRPPKAAKWSAERSSTAAALNISRSIGLYGRPVEKSDVSR